MINKSDRDRQVAQYDDVSPDDDKLDPEGAPSPISVYERPQRQISPWLLLILAVLLLIAAYFLIQLFF